jgi:phosphate transport system protein
MAREQLDKKIKKLRKDVQTLESMVRKATQEAVHALIHRDSKLAKKVYRNDNKINKKRFQIERDCLITIATQQPMATDLRILASILEVTSELERMGDYAKGIARIHFMTGGESLVKPIGDLVEMADITVDMLRRAVKAFVHEDAETARKIPDEDDKVDEIFNRIYHGLVDHMGKDPKSVDHANHLQWAAHNIERMSDRVTNICERTIFIVTGEMHELEESDDEWDFH